MSTGSGEDAPAATAHAPPMQAVGIHGLVGQFDPRQEEWCDYIERLIHYFVANDIAEEAKKRAILLTAVGPGTYRLLKTLASPRRLDELRFSELVDLATRHYNPKPSPIVKRFEFNSRSQKEGESIAVFVAQLRKIAEHCDYGAVLSDMLRDRLVCGTSNKGIQRRLLLQAHLTFDRAMEIALAAEAAEKDLERLTGDKDHDKTPSEGPPTTQIPVYTVGRQRNQRNNTQRRRSEGSPAAGKSGCYRCGGSHKPTSCPCKDYVCHYCKKKGHIAKVCLKRDKSNPEQAHSVKDQSPQQDPTKEYQLLHVGAGSSNTPYHALLQLNGHPVQMEVDTGASVSVVGEEVFKSVRLGEKVLELQPSVVQLRSYTGEEIPVRGSALVSVAHNGQSATLPLIVTEGNGPSLIGRNWLSTLRLDWQRIFVVKCNPSLQEVLDKYGSVFREGLGELQGITAKIYIDRDERPRFFKPYPVAFALRQKVEEELDRLQSLGVIKAVQFAAPIVPVRKRDGRIRICGDFKVTINRAAKVEKYPLPRIEELFASLARGKLFTKLDLSHAYLQVPLDPDSRKYATINTHKGLFEYQRLPFGIASAPSIFQCVMETLLQGIEGVCVYIDDILVTGSTEAEHLRNLAQVLEKLESAGMRLKKGKCAFLLPSVSYLGHVISAEGLGTERAKVRAIVDAPAPQNVGELRAFLGMVTYYGRFLPDLATILAPLYVLLRKSARWRWRGVQQKAFAQIKDLLQSGRVLTHFDDKLPLILACDASPYGLGAVLSHRLPTGEERPIGFASRTLTKAEGNYSHLDKEGLAIMYGVGKFHQYLYGRSFEIKTDHKPLTHIFKESRAIPTMASGRIQRWALILGGYDYTITYKEGKNMANADALSRLPLRTPSIEVPRPPELVHLVEYLDSTPLSSRQIKRWTDQDPTLSQVRQWVQEGWPERHNKSQQDLSPYLSRRNELSTEEGCVLWGTRVIIPPKGRKAALEILHESHPGMGRMKSLACGYLWWPNLDKEIEQYVKRCSECQMSRSMPPAAPPHSWAPPEGPWSRVHIDYAGPFQGRMFLLLVDAHSKWLEIHETSTTTSSATIELLRRTFANVGLPQTIVSDNAPNFTSEEFTAFLKHNGIRHLRSAPYHPASNGIVERAVRTFKEGMRRLNSGSMNTRLSRFLFRYRITPLTASTVSSRAHVGQETSITPRLAGAYQCGSVVTRGSSGNTTICSW